MIEFISRLPEELERKILEYVLCDSVKLKLLLNKYPLNNDLFSKLTNNQLSNLYRFACLENVIPYTFEYHPSTISSKIVNLFPNIYIDKADQSSVWNFARNCAPIDEINKYFRYGPRFFSVSNQQFIDSIIQFCNYILEFPRLHQNKPLEKYCDKMVYKMFICVLILRR